VGDELERVARLAALFGRNTARGARVGIGDDAAVLDASLVVSPGERVVWTIDDHVEGTHFRRAWLSWKELGRRSFMAAASDVCAMGATPWCALTSLTLTADVTDDMLDALAEGQGEAAADVGAPIVGGNLAAGAIACVTTTLLGTCAREITRGGARAGDSLWLAGEVGLAAAGLAALVRGMHADARLADAVHAWRAPIARVVDGLAMNAANAHAAIDLSDGLARDVAHLAEASGLCAVFDEAALLAANARTIAAARALGVAPLDLMLYGGEDYALVTASDAPIAGFTRIGEMREGDGIFLGATKIEPRGFDHFTSFTTAPP
jgi:thiamine-monophosphate kinase